MTEDQIERHVERSFDRYDAAFMAGRIDQVAYDALARDLNVWADNQYRLLAAAKLERPSDITLPLGWTWERVESERAKWGISSDMVPIATAMGVVAWGTINSIRKAPLAASVVEVSNVQEYGLTQKLSNSIRCF